MLVYAQKSILKVILKISIEIRENVVFGSPHQIWSVGKV